MLATEFCYKNSGKYANFERNITVMIVGFVLQVKKKINSLK
jgi:hypothetical protein